MEQHLLSQFAVRQSEFIAEGDLLDLETKLQNTFSAFYAHLKDLEIYQYP
jgi:hypothetical protein